MLVKIALVVSLCSPVNMTTVMKKKAELEKQNPSAQVTVRLDKKCMQAQQEFKAE